MKIANRLRFSFWTMLPATVVIGLVAAWMMIKTANTAGSTLHFFEVDRVLEIVSDGAREYNVAATGMAAAAAVSAEDQQKLDDIQAKMKQGLDELKRVDPEDAPPVEKAIAEFVEQTKTTLQAAVEAGASAQGQVKPASSPAPKPAATKPGGKKGKAGAKAPPPPAEEEAALDADAEAGASAELADAQSRIAAMEAGRSFAGQLGDLNAKLMETVGAIGKKQHTTVDAALHASKGTAWVLIGVLAVLVLAAVGFVGYMFRGVQSEVLRPLELLADGARRVSTERDLTVAVPVAGDEEVQNLGRAFGEMMETLRGITVEMRGATDRLLSSATELGGITRAQGESISRQASALEEARRTTTALRESSRETVGQAEGVLRVAQKAEALGRDGESAMTENLSSAEVIQGQTRQVVERIARLATSAQRIGAITATVKDLADQSNVVALNAAIEASRAGEAGVGFGVVAREIRSLADRSIRATIEVRTVLAEVLNGIRESATLVEAAHSGLEEGSVRTRKLGDSVAGLTGIVRENLGAVREIAGAVASQGTGIGQISNAVEDLSLMMEDTLKAVNNTGDAASVLREVSEQVSSSVKVFRL